MNRYLILVMASLLLAACTATPAASLPGRPAQIVAPLGAPLYSDDELAAMELKVVTEADFRAYPLPPVKLAPQTRVELFTDIRTIDLKGSVASDPLMFSRLRVMDGPAKDRIGWVQVGWAG